MTSIESGRVLVRETSCTERRRAIIVELHPRELVMRLKGTRRRYTLPYDAALWTAIKAEAEAARLEKIRQRKARKKGA